MMKEYSSTVKFDVAPTAANHLQAIWKALQGIIFQSIPLGTAFYSSLKTVLFSCARIGSASE